MTQEGWWALAPLALVTLATGTWTLIDLVRAIPTRQRLLASRPLEPQKRIYANAITCGYDGREHHVTDTSFHKGQPAGRYVALCGHIVEPLPMSAPSGRPCVGCLGVLRNFPEGAR
ncbi:hypothetical protein NLX83_37370 [Allokutzneria sp. A3M-2-11 16]|uniref:hypothetical protein n=1 Tax=Allokutzneria sp. A3M-2-11 16 TaxID=2962043 RepID=UPI0020B75BA6|nr:hypothetical protein [Allokutzneria sp. A3M-2-11 16]MCP3804952.1 hypothetical protein [Allokutzneria sp. A3M-2-11 16]